MDFEELDDSEAIEAPTLSVSIRCRHERARPPVYWNPKPGAWKDAVGVFYGLRFPWSERTIKWLGAPWLTKAFQKAGTLHAEGEVKEITCVRTLGFRAAAERLLLTVEYGPGCAGLHTKLLAKVPLDCSERLGKQAKQMESKESVGPLPFLKRADFFAELNYYRLYESDAPLRMPKFYYGDISEKTSHFILITEWVPLPGETDDAKEGGVSLLFPDDDVPLLDAEQAGRDEECFIVGPHGGCLAVCERNAETKSSALGVSLERDQTAIWKLRRVGKNNPSYQLVSASTGAFLTVTSSDEQAFWLCPRPSEDALWAMETAPGERHKCFFRSAHGTYLASLQDTKQTLYLSQNRDDWEKWRRVPVTPFKGAAATIEHLELRGVAQSVCNELVAVGAAFAGEYKAGNLGSRELIEASFERLERPTDARLWETDLDWRGLGDTEFIEKAAKAQEFILTVGAKLFPDGVVTRSMMKGYRAMLVTTRANLSYIHWFIHSNENYVALGNCRLDMDSAYRWHEDASAESGLGLRDWEAVTIGPVGRFLWSWLRFADSDVLMSSENTDALLKKFIGVYHAKGGPLLSLEDLRIHFMLSAALDSVQLLNAVPEIYRCWPKNEWTSIKGMRDTRLLGQTLGQGSLWLCLKSLVNIALVLSTCDMVELLFQVMPLIFHCVVHDPTTSEDRLSLGPGDVDVRRIPEAGAAIVCLLPPGFRLISTGRRHRDGASTEYEEVKYPVYGWVDTLRLRSATTQEISTLDPSVAATSEIFERMYHSRRQYTGHTPLNMSAISTLKLCDTLTKYDKMFQTLQRFCRGECQAMTGGFLVEERHRPWWPKGYEDWATHTFLVFDDGSIGDITADQYDDVPQLWWPADAKRYSFDSTKADAAELLREKIGLNRWTELMERDRTIAPAKKRYKWWIQDKTLKDKNLGIQLSDKSRDMWKSRENALKNEAPRRALKNRSRDAASVTVLRECKRVELPAVERLVDMGEGRQSATFRRISNSDELDIWLVENMFRLEELDELVKFSEDRNGFAPSLQNTNTGYSVQDLRRTSHSCTLHWPLLWGGTLEEVQGRGDLAPEVEKELVAGQHITNLCARVMDCDSSFIEPLQMVKYTPGQFYRAHLDCHKEPDRLSSHNGEQRTHTLLVFLCDVPEDDGGGHLHFPRLGIRVLPKKGAAVLWRNTKEWNGKPDQDSLHEGEPPLRSEKIALNVWQVDRPFTFESILEGRERKLRLTQQAQQTASAALEDSGAPTSQPLLLRKLRERAEEQAVSTLPFSMLMPTAAAASRADPFAGYWKDQAGVEMLIKGSEVRGPDGSIEIQVESETACVLTIGAQNLRGQLETAKSGDGAPGGELSTRLVWSDGDIWTRTRSLDQG